MNEPRELETILDDLMKFIPSVDDKLKAVGLVREIVDGQHETIKEAIDERTRA